MQIKRKIILNPSNERDKMIVQNIEGLRNAGCQIHVDNNRKIIIECPTGIPEALTQPLQRKQYEVESD